ncbi:cytochrome P450 [Vararia minispora EC-137]|uniref:Cytochrome P450 n=1 Tax=Vararia minispora EC-137 TaxID=1314806 RepID=A0ACB8QMW2_9AGAM|nr:cytochrome P450 [Vararia minispora EC-137]
MSTSDLSFVGRGFITLAGLTLLYTLLSRLLAQRFHRSALRDMAGPPCISWLRGSASIPHYEAQRLELEWVKTYGKTFKFYGPLKARIFTTEGTQHRLQRRILTPAFGSAELRRQTEVFVSKANAVCRARAPQLCSIWKDMLANSKRSDDSAKVDALSWLTKVTLDIICVAGFNYDTDSLHAPDDDPDELNRAVRSLFSFSIDDPLFVLQLIFPIFRRIVCVFSLFTNTPPDKYDSRPDATMRRIGMRLMEEKKALAAVQSGQVASGIQATRKDDIEGSDLLSLLIKANMATDLPDRLRLSDEDMVAQMPAFIVAGHETTATAITWGLFSLCLAQHVQTKLREELLGIATDTPSMDDLNDLPYLDMVIREVLRLYPPAGSMERSASYDDVIPLSEPYTDKQGKVHHEIVVSRGDNIFLPYHAFQLSEDIWGSDAGEFRPERWEAVPETAKVLPNVWSNLPVFGAGPHACMGYRFAVVEMKALLFALVRNFELHLAVSPSEVVRQTIVVMRPTLTTHPAAGPQLPLTIRPVRL